MSVGEPDRSALLDIIRQELFTYPCTTLDWIHPPHILSFHSAQLSIKIVTVSPIQIKVSHTTNEWKTNRHNNCQLTERTEVPRSPCQLWEDLFKANSSILPNPTTHPILDFHFIERKRDRMIQIFLRGILTFLPLPSLKATNDKDILEHLQWLHVYLVYQSDIWHWIQFCGCKFTTLSTLPFS